MKRRNRNILIFALTIILLVSINLSLNTFFTSLNVQKLDSELAYTYSEITIYIKATNKISFADEKDDIFKHSLENGLIRNTSSELVADIIENASWNIDEDATLEDTLSSYGVYLFPTSIETANVGVNVSLSKPIVLYNANDQTWIVTHNGNWLNNKWDQALFAGSLGKKDSYGIKYTNISGTFNTTVKNVYAYITDQKTNKKKETTNRSGVNEGFCFEFEDFTYGIFKKEYVGYRWYGSCVYDSKWENFSSYITAYHNPQ